MGGLFKEARARDDNDNVQGMLAYPVDTHRS